MHGAAPKQRVRARGERRVELADRAQDRAGLDDRVDAEVRARPVRRAPFDLDPRPDEALVRDGDRELGRLGDDGRVGLDGAKHLLDAEARVLLVGDRRDDDVAVQAQRGGLAAGDEGRGDARLHVVGAAAVEPVALDARVVRCVHPPDAHRVDVPAEQQRAPASRAAGTNDDARPAGRALEHVGLQTGGERPARDERRDLALAGAARHERRVDRVDRHELAQQLAHSHGPSASAAKRAAEGAAAERAAGGAAAERAAGGAAAERAADGAPAERAGEGAAEPRTLTAPARAG